MAYFWIVDGAIGGSSEAPLNANQYPPGFMLLEMEGANLPLDQLYWNGFTIVSKPSQPSIEHQWDAQSYKWLVPGLEPNWQGFLDIVGIPMFQLLAQVTDPLAQQYSGNLKIEFNEHPDINLVWLCLMWNGSLGTIEVFPSTEQFLNDAAIANNIPLTLSQGVLAPV